MTSIKPRKIRGPWADGYVLDLHSTGSTFLGYDEFGHSQFETHRTEIGELLYRLKYRSDVTALAEIGAASQTFIKSWGIEFDSVVPVPPTRQRRVQPVFQLVDDLARRFSVPALKAAVKKRGDTEELKNLHEFEERREALANAFTVDRPRVAGKQILLVDDLIRSGATMSAVAEALSESGAAAVYAFALTRTRRV